MPNKVCKELGMDELTLHNAVKKQFCLISPGMCFFQVVDTSKSIADIPEWFKGSRLNYAENLLKHKDNDKIALYAASKGN